MMWRFVIALSVFSMPGAALAEDGTDVKGAEAAYNEAEKLLAQEQPAQACVRYADSYRLDPQLGALLHVADCNERIDKLATAWRGFEAGYQLALKKGDERASVARERADALLPRLSYLRVNLPPDAGATAQVVVDGTPLEASLVGKDLAVDRGTHTIVVTGEGLEKWRTEAVAKGVPGVQYFDVPSWRAPPPGPDGRDSTGNWLGMDPSVRRVLGWTAVGFGVAGVGLSTYFFVLLNSKKKDAEAVENAFDTCTVECNQDATNAALVDLADDQKRARTAGIISGVAGAVFLTGGALLLFVNPPAPERSASRAPQIGIGLGSVTLRGEF
jgi:hypothetical protein